MISKGNPVSTGSAPSGEPGWRVAYSGTDLLSTDEVDVITPIPSIVGKVVVGVSSSGVYLRYVHAVPDLYYASVLGDRDNTSSESASTIPGTGSGVALSLLMDGAMDELYMFANCNLWDSRNGVMMLARDIGGIVESYCVEYFSMKTGDGVHTVWVR